MTDSARVAARPPLPCVLRQLGHQEYEPLWRRMQKFTETREQDTQDELWLCEHPPVFTLGMAASGEHVLAPGDIPVVQIDRGGQVTYHGPGQLMVYPLLNVRRLGLGVRALVMALESAVIDTLAKHNLEAVARRDAPGVYVDGAKVASIGLRIRRGGSYHGMAVNLDMDVSPFQRINPCGMANLPVTDFRRLGVTASAATLTTELTTALSQHLGLTLTEA